MHISNDSKSYYYFAENIRRHGSFSHEDPRNRSHPPSAYRLPGYPVFVSLCLALSPRLVVIDKGPGIYLHHFTGSFLQGVLCALTAIISMLITLRLTRSMLLAHVAMYGVGLDNAMLVMAIRLLPEILVTFFLMAFAFAFMQMLREERFLSACSAGSLLGLISMTRAHFQFFIPIGAVVLIYQMVKFPEKRKKYILFICIFVFIPLGMTHIWKLRNYRQMGRYYSTDRGGLALDVRADYNLMTPKEYWASFPYFASLNSKWNFMKYFKGINSEDTKRLHISLNNPHSIYLKARHRRSELIKKYGGYTRADKIQLNEALGKIRSHPGKHLMASLPFGFRGLFAKQGLRGPFLFSVFFFMFALSIYARHRDLFLIFLPGVFSFAFYALVSVCEPRYNMPIIPMLYVASIVGFHWVYLKLFKPEKKI